MYTGAEKFELQRAISSNRIHQVSKKQNKNWTNEDGDDEGKKNISMRCDNEYLNVNKTSHDLRITQICSYIARSRIKTPYVCANETGKKVEQRARQQQQQRQPKTI